MYLDKNDMVISRTIAHEKEWEPEETKFLKSVIKKGSNVVDIGAHIGYFTLLFSKWVGKKGKVFSFEPDVNNFKFLSKNILANQSKNVTVFNKAISNKDETTYLYLNSENTGDNRILDFYVDDLDSSREKIKVECVRLDSVIPTDQRIDVIKIDVQGAEMLVLQGMDTFLTNSLEQYMLIEFWPFAIEKSGFTPKEMLKKIKEMGFEIFIFENEKLVQFSVDHEIVQNFLPDDFINLICKKQKSKK